MIIAIQAILNIILIVIVYILLKQVDVLSNMKKNYSTIIVIQKIMEILGEKIPSSKKIEEINDVFLDNYNIMYSTIVSYSQGEHIVKASNVDPSYRSIFEYLIEEPMFKHNVQTHVPKYVTTDSGVPLKYSSASERDIKSVLFLPLYIDEMYAGYWLLEDTRLNAFDELEMVQLSILKDNLGLIIENSNYQAAIENMAISDRLTGLYNRNYLYSTGKNVIDSYQVSTVVICDIDFFKKVNDSYGHDIGDKVLVTIADVSRELLDSEDVFVRFGGEEFVMLLPGKGIPESKPVIDRIKDSIENTKILITDGKIINVTVSYGISIFKKGENLDDAIKNADIALYRAKQNGRNRIEVA